MTDVDVRWLSLFADVPDPAAAIPFWSEVLRATAGEAEGERGEFRPLVPASGDPVLWFQRIGSGRARWHVDLHVPDVGRATEVAVAAGAVVSARFAGLAALSTPAGQPFCLVRESRRSRRRPAPTGPDGGRSLADQVCLDIPADRYDAECDFWAALTGWSVRDGGSPEFRRLAEVAELPLQFLLQRLDDDDGTSARAHLDFSADEVAAEVERHVAAGAEVARVFEHWTTLTDPVGLVYCVTRRVPPAGPDLG
jgi:predicted enzyme related to lactoylglutathione lyase